MPKTVHDTDIGSGLEISGGKLNAAGSMATDAEVTAAIAAQDSAENAVEATATLRDDYLRRAQYHLSTSALIEVSGSAIRFSVDSSQTHPLARVLLMGAGEGGHAGATGYFDINPPSAGAVIKGLGIADITVDINGYIPLPVHGSLYYKLPPANTRADVQGEWYVSTYNNADYVVPTDCLLICQQTPNIVGGGMIYLWDGRQLFQGKNYTDTGWIALAPNFTSGITNYGGGYQTPRFRRSGNRVYVEGLVRMANTAPKIIATLPVGFRPSATYVLHSTQDLDRGVRINVHPNGVIEQFVPSFVDWLSLEFSFGLE